MYVIKDTTGKVRRTNLPSLGFAKARLGHGWTVWYQYPEMRRLTEQYLTEKDKVSRVRGKVASARVAGEHSRVLVHMVPTGRILETRVF